MPMPSARQILSWLVIFVATLAVAWLSGAFANPDSPVATIRWTPNLDAASQEAIERELGLLEGLQREGRTWR